MCNNKKNSLLLSFRYSFGTTWCTNTGSISCSSWRRCTSYLQLQFGKWHSVFGQMVQGSKRILSLFTQREPGHETFSISWHQCWGKVSNYCYYFYYSFTCSRFWNSKNITQEKHLMPKIVMNPFFDPRL